MLGLRQAFHCDQRHLVLAAIEDVHRNRGDASVAGWLEGMHISSISRRQGLQRRHDSGLSRIGRADRNGLDGAVPDQVRPS